MIRLRGRLRPEIAHPGRAACGSVALGILVAASTWLIAAAAAPEYPRADLPFFVLTGLMIAAAFSLIAWYGWQLRAVDWPTTELLSAAKPSRICCNQKRNVNASTRDWKSPEENHAENARSADGAAPSASLSQQRRVDNLHIGFRAEWTVVVETCKPTRTK